MAVITSGKTFANGEQLSADKLNQVITAATFNSSDAVDGSTITLVGGAMAVADSGITKAKIENVANMKALGNTSGSATSPQEVAILDENDMTSDSDTSLATQKSIKAYVDATAVFTKSFVSSDQTFPNNNAEVSVAHSLGEVPKIIQVFAKITTSVDGYASGDFVLINSGDAPGTGNAVSFCTSSNVGFYRNGAIRLADRTGSGGPISLSSSNCQLVLKAFA